MYLFVVFLLIQDALPKELIGFGHVSCNLFWLFLITYCFSLFYIWIHIYTWGIWSFINFISVSGQEQRSTKIKCQEQKSVS